MDPTQLRDGNVRVDLRGFQALVPDQGLNEPHVRGVFDGAGVVAGCAGGSSREGIPELRRTLR
ncbi:MAG: hypothetical protein ACQESR_09510 [Planctomycetota bacterium]